MTGGGDLDEFLDDDDNGPARDADDAQSDGAVDDDPTAGASDIGGRAGEPGPEGPDGR